ncbi:zf-HC2 domain-containing protein [Bacillus sp. SCS-153A]|uniref:zf-HC2 domain-containing protein n=1 Tax=Rossellomorea sedimentorum TaxID=3115294 RepID=UPI00390582AA
MVNYSCDLVQDLYPLYIEGDLSPSVTKKVEEHLSECDNCKVIYEKGEGFSPEDHTEIGNTTVPQSLDERIRLSMKLRRMKIFIAVLSTLFLIIIVNLYQNQRHELFSAYHQVYRGADELNHLIQTGPEASSEELGFLKDMFFHSMYEGVEDLIQSLNWLEKQKLRGSNLYVAQNSLYTTLDTFNLRKADGRWDDVDQQVHELLTQYSEEYFQTVEEEYQKFNHGYSSYFKTVDVEGLSTPLEKINHLTYIYNRFHQLPDEVNQLETKEIKKKLGSIFQAETEEIYVEKGRDYRYRFTINEKKLSGEVDAFTGYPLQVDDLSAPRLKGKLLEVNEVEEKATSWINKVYGPDKKFEVKYLGVNVNYSSNIDDQFYSFGFMPVFDTMPAYAFSDQTFMVHFDARSGEFRMMHSVENIPLSEDFHTDVTRNISPEEGLEVLHKKVEIEDKNLAEKREYEYIDSFVIYSSTTGGLVPVHAYGMSDKDYTWRYINSENGKEELLYNGS